jgi:hypothetical protein
MEHPRTSRWSGLPPRECENCRNKILVSFVNGPQAVGGKWKMWCIKCYFLRGSGFGEGRGTMFAKHADGFWYKVPNE